MGNNGQQWTTMDNNAMGNNGQQSAVLHASLLPFLLRIGRVLSLPLEICHFLMVVVYVCHFYLAVSIICKSMTISTFLLNSWIVFF